MSGTSMDGIDLVHCTLSQNDSKWVFKINAAKLTNNSDFRSLNLPLSTKTPTFAPDFN